MDLSVLTDPLPNGRHVLTEPLKKTARLLRNAVNPPAVFTRSPYRGHFAVTRSLVEGLQKAGIPSNYNPQKLSELGETVVVLSNLGALRQSIGLKRAGVVRKLLAGPNLVEFPSDARDLLCAEEVDFCITPGPLTCRIYVEDCPELAGRCFPWPAGVDTRYWIPSAEKANGRSILFYDKRSQGRTDAMEPYVALVEAKGYQVSILRYGSYLREEYRDRLQRSHLLIGFTAAESQGIAWAEAWAADIPTLMWRKDRHSFDHPRSRGRTFATSPAPHLTEATGRFFSNRDEFSRVFADWESGCLKFAPREWVLGNMSDEVCARRLYRLASSGTTESL